MELAKALQSQTGDNGSKQSDSENSGVAQAGRQPGHDHIATHQMLELARNSYADRRRRDRVIGQADLFGEPAWDILLDLFIAHIEGKDVSVSSACIGSAAPPTTGLRWLGVLQDNGLVVREHDPRDQRRILVRLTEQGLSRMSDYFRKSTPN